jgi:hypothetical protein
MALSINMAKPVRTVKLLNETQNILASDLSNRKILTLISGKHDKQYIHSF